MKSVYRMIVLIGVGLFSTSAVADDRDTAIHNLTNNSEVTLTGTVDKASGGDEHAFMLNTAKGIIVVKLPEDQPQHLKVGDNVTVTGIVKKPLLGILGSELEASNVRVTFQPL